MKSWFENIILVIIIQLVFASTVFSGSGETYGNIYREDPSATEPTPLEGGAVYLYNEDTGWIGPVITGKDGSYNFYNLPEENYLMRVYDSKEKLWEQEINYPLLPSEGIGSDSDKPLQINDPIVLPAESNLKK